MNYATIKETDIANGLGIRVSLFVSGCTHHCKGCFNEDTWDFSYGEPFTDETKEKLLSLLEPDYIKGLSLLGGEPMEKCNQEALLPFLKSVKEKYPQKDIWCYSGYTFEQISGGKAHFDGTDEILQLLDVLVDGPFILEKKNIMLKFRGSENQRVLDVQKSLKEGRPIEYQL